MAIWELIRDGLTELGGKASFQELKDHVIKKYPDKNIAQNFYLDSSLITVNSPIRVNFHGGKMIRLTNSGNKYDCLYKTENNYFESYDELKHGIWQIFDNKGKLEVKLFSPPCEKVSPLLDDLLEIDHFPDIPETIKKQLINARLGQGWFRNQLIEKYKTCMITNISSEILLRASHIKPWSKSSNKERLDPNNGLLLAIHMDALFDKGLISFKFDGTILISTKLNQKDKAMLNLCENTKLNLSPKVKSYMEYHRTKIFMP